MNVEGARLGAAPKPAPTTQQMDIREAADRRKMDSRFVIDIHPFQCVSGSKHEEEPFASLSNFQRFEWCGVSPG